VCREVWSAISSSTPGGTVDPPSTTDLRAGIRVSDLSVAWTAVASTAAVVTGIVDHALVLVAFGLTGLLDGAGSLTLSLHFRHALARQSVSERRERLALRVVSVGLLVVGGSTVAESIRRLVVGGAAHRSGIGLGIAASSIFVLAALMVGKRRIAPRLRSGALMADSWLSATGAFLGVVTVAGTVIAGPGRSWIDPAAALVVASLAATIGVRELRREERAWPIAAE
jgi:divalent metal cation (Fe/Co/Zn/Cd) transporter